MTIPVSDFENSGLYRYFSVSFLGRNDPINENRSICYEKIRLVAMNSLQGTFIRFFSKEKTGIL